MRGFLKYWLPVLIWMAVVFGASSDSHSSQHSSSIVKPLLRWLFPHMSEAEIESIHHFLRKCCHLAEYAILGLLVFRAFICSKSGLPVWSWPHAGGALLIVFLYACSNEFHQRFVPTRTSSFIDVLIDTAGGAIGLLMAWIYHCWKKTKTTMVKI